jgi:hypothetical protein
MKDYPKKEENIVNQKVSFLNQLIISLEQAEGKLEEAYNKEDHKQFKITRDFVFKIQKKISETLK